MLKIYKNLVKIVKFYIFAHNTSRTNITNITNMEEIISNVINNLICSFDIAFCFIINIATYLVITTIKNIKKHTKLTTWNKRCIFLVVSIIISTVYYIIGSDFKIIFNSLILAPVSWSWIFKPICVKFKIDYNNKSNAK